MTEVDCLPLNAVHCRAYDKASSERSTAQKFPDFTACIKVSKDKDGFYYLSGDFHEDAYDEETQTFGRYCKRPGDRDATIKKQAMQDGNDVTIIFSVDPGQSGQSEFNTSSKELVEEGFIVKKDPTPTNKSKLTRFTPFATLAEQGWVKVVRGSFDEPTYQALMAELESFDGTRSTSTRKDDWADAVASGINFLCQEKVYKAPPVMTIDSPTMYASHMGSGMIGSSF